MDLSFLLNPYVFTAVILFLDMIWVYLIALYLKNNGIVDIAYGLAYILVVATTLYNFGEYPLGGVVVTLISVWGLRLAIRIHERGRGKPEDFRYAAWRAQWQWVKTRSFFQIYMLQGLIIYLIALPAITAASHNAPSMPALTVIGIAIWLIGFFFEALGDYQLDRYIRDPSHKGSIMQEGLWSITRHPNYFGEATMWWGIYLVTLPALLSTSIALTLFTLVSSPILITYLLLKVSGVPMLEKAMSQKPGWAQYASRVSVFIPWFPKK
jgi:steroid 5-alpha reductase family enzyme